MVTALTLKNFKCFRELELPQLAPITLLGGRNNVGKTALMEALFLFFDRQNPGMILRQFVWRGASAMAGSGETLWAPIFFDYETSREIEVAPTIDGRTQRLSLALKRSTVARTLPVTERTTEAGNGSELLDLPIAVPHMLQLTYSSGNADEPQVAELRVGAQGLELRSQNPFDSDSIAAFFAARMHLPAAEDAGRLGHLDVRGQETSVLQVLQVIEPRLKSLSTVAVGGVPVIHGDIGIARKIPVALMGDGLARLLSITLGIAANPNACVFVDEIENGIHYSVMPQVWRGLAAAAREFNCQVFATTHSYECLQAAHEGLDEESAPKFAYVRLHRSGREITGKSFSADSLGAALESGLEIR